MKVGLTGGIASGKSTVAKYLKARGAVIIDADQVARTCVAPATRGFQQIVDQFGAEVVTASGELDRKLLGQFVFNDQALLDRLNAILQPLIREELLNQIERASREAQLVVADIPLLYEQSYESLFDQVLVAYVDEATQLARLKKRDQLSEVEAKKRIAAQLPLSEKAKRADYVIDNSKDLENTGRQIDQWLKQLC